MYSEGFKKLVEAICKDRIGDSGYDNIFNAICKWPITNCTSLWGFRIHNKKSNRGVWIVGLKTKYMTIGDTLRDLQLEGGKRIVSHVNEYTYLGGKNDQRWKSRTRN